MSFNSILGKIELGYWELGTVSSAATPIRFSAAASPTGAVSFVGGTPLRDFSAVLGTIAFGRLELGQITTINSQALLGKLGFVATAEANSTVLLVTVQALTVIGTAEPNGSIVTGLILTGTSYPTCNLLLSAPVTFVGQANPLGRVFFDTNELQNVLPSGPLERSLKLLNFTY